MNVCFYYIRRLSNVIRSDGDLDAVTNEIVSYRAYHLVVEYFNEFMKTVLVLFLLGCGTAEIVSTALLIRQTKTDMMISLPLNLFFSACVLESGLVILGVYGFPGEFYQKSKLSLDFLRREASHKIIAARKRKYFFKFLRSCYVLKIRFGLSNFIEKTTPPEFQKFCTDRIIDILLTQNTS